MSHLVFLNLVPAIQPELSKQTFFIKLSGKDGFKQLERRGFDYLILESSVQEVSLLSFMAYCRRYLPGTVTIVLTDMNLGITPEKVQFAGAKFCVYRPQHREVIADIIYGMGAGKSFIETVQ